MPTYRAQVRIPFFSGLPSDVLTNTFHFYDKNIGADFPAAIASLTPALAAFYTSIYGTGHTIASYTRPTNATVHWYNLADPTPRSPTIVPLGASMVSGDGNVPTEVACVLSFQGQRVSGLPQSRRRGRIFLGALSTGWLANGSSQLYPIFSTIITEVIEDAAMALLAVAPPTGPLSWAVWSEVNQAPVEITNGWIDLSPDTQRRRSVIASARETWPPD